jgi:uncharacterized damage-inducible protein DinB
MNNLSEMLRKEFDRRVFEESVVRIRKSIGILSEEEVWHAYNQHTNSVGNLILHLEGNVIQWICSGIGREKDDRHRDQEFVPHQGILKRDLMTRLNMLRERTTNTLTGVTDTMLLEKRKVQGFDETVLSIIIHVIEHFSYHTGQIALIAKEKKNCDLAFYGKVDLNQKC